MSADWLDVPWPELYPLMHDPLRFPGLQLWGDIEEIRSSAGTYIVVALDAEGNCVRRKTLPRLFAPDETGTLYIGDASNLAGRLGELSNSILHDRETGHGLKKLRQPPWSERFPATHLAICWFPASSRGEANKREAHFAMELYAKKFGERPPFDGFK